MPLNDLTGQHFDRLTVIRRGDPPSKNGGANWFCRCSCGKATTVRGASLMAGTTKSCGCIHSERLSERLKTHGASASPEHRIWRGMRERVRNPNRINHYRYGGRGIIIDPRWDDFAVFLADMGPKPSPRHTLERRDNDGPYSPENCFWATRREQSRNTSKTHFLTHAGQTLAVVEWAEKMGCLPSHIYQRLRIGWSVERALTEPIAAREILTEVDVRAIRALGDTAVTHEAIAALFGVSRPAVSLIVSRKNWKHVA